ncbi:MAG TPA: TonB-dependent receptor [Chitinophagaceae bacterium]|nr:TonB-dependent receptor [Chitinophagaceae bacterium]
MNKICLLILALTCASTIFSQNVVRIKVINAETKEPIQNAAILCRGAENLPATDTAGIAWIYRLPKGNRTLIVAHLGFIPKEIPIVIPFEDSLLTVELEPKIEEEEEVIIQSTRSSRTIQDIPTRVEFVAGEELDEKANMKPGDIRMVLNESTGITTQQTSATSANASIRIQGLDGRYTQILKDGFPLYAGFSGGLGLLQTPPLDLKQFEVIKGSASTLYGGGAIAGLVNLISKTPQDERELKFHLDVTSAGGLNTSGFYGKKFGKVGLTLFASRNSNSAYDPADIGLTAIPKFERYTVNPKLFVYFTDKTELTAGVNITTEERTGGDVAYIKGNNPAGYYETNNSDRYSAKLNFQHHFGKSSHITIKNSFNRFHRTISSPAYAFNGTQNGTFTEATYASHGAISEWIAGVNLITDDFKEQRITSPTLLRNYQQLTGGIFVQNNWKVSDKFRLETGLRGDAVKDYGFTLLPRVSALFKFSPKLSSRIGGGLGYKAPNIFTEESERLQYKNVLPINDAVNKLERSYGVNADINYKTKLADGEVSFSINHLFFYTRIHDPLLLQPDGVNFRFNNVNGHIDSKGVETNVKLGYKDFKLFLGYTFTNAYLHQGSSKTESLLTPKHRLNTVLLYEVEEKWKVGLEAYYFSKQQLSNGATGRSYWITGFMAEKLWEKLSLYINFENFLDTRQTKFDSIYTGSIANPVFRDIYAPLDGFVVNGGIKLRL